MQPSPLSAELFFWSSQTETLYLLKNDSQFPPSWQLLFYFLSLRIWLLSGTSGKESKGSIPRLARYPGVGNGTPLQYSCLENSMGSGAWWDTAYGATKSQTLLSDWTQYNTIGGIIQYLVFWDRLFYLACLQSLCVLCVRECTIMSNSMDCSLPGSSSYGIFQARILEPGAVSSSRGSSLPRDQIRVSCIGRQILYH